MRANQSFIFFTHHIWGERVLWGAVFMVQTSYKMQYFTIYLAKLHSFNIQDYRSKRRLLILAKPFKKFPKSPIRPAGSNFWQAPDLLKELRFNVIKNLLSLFFINGFVTMCNLKKRLIRSAFWVLLQAMFMHSSKQTEKWWKLHF